MPAVLSLCPREGNRSAPIRRVCSVKSTRPRGEGPRGGKQDSCFSTDFSASSVTREQSPLFFGTKNVKIEFQNLYYSSINTGEKRVQIRDSITISFSFSFFFSDFCCVVFRRDSLYSDSFCFEYYCAKYYQTLSESTARIWIRIGTESKWNRSSALRRALSKWCETKQNLCNAERNNIEAWYRSSQFSLRIKTSLSRRVSCSGGRETSGSNRPMEHGLVNKDGETWPRNKFTTD